MKGDDTEDTGGLWLPSRLPVAFLAAALAAVASGAWYVSAQKSAIDTLYLRFEDFKSETQQRQALVYAIDTRLTRIEATLAQLANNQAAAKALIPHDK